MYTAPVHTYLYMFGCCYMRWLRIQSISMASPSTVSSVEKYIDSICQKALYDFQPILYQSYCPPSKCLHPIPDEQQQGYDKRPWPAHGTVPGHAGRMEPRMRWGSLTQRLRGASTPAAHGTGLPTRRFARRTATHLCKREHWQKIYGDGNVYIDIQHATHDLLITHSRLTR